MAEAIIRVRYDEELLNADDRTLEGELGWLEESGIEVVAVEEIE